MAALASPPDTPNTPVPKTNRNPARSLRPAPVYFTIGVTEYEIPALPAADWLSVLMQPDRATDDLFIDLMPDGLELVMSGALDPLDADELATDIIEEVTARHWWVATRLIDFIADTWDVMGAEATFNHVDPERLSLAAWLDAMLVLLMQRIDKDQVPLFVARLEAPPAGEELAEEELAMSEGQFLSMVD